VGSGSVSPSHFAGILISPLTTVFDHKLVEEAILYSLLALNSRNRPCVSPLPCMSSINSSRLFCQFCALGVGVVTSGANSGATKLVRALVKGSRFRSLNQWTSQRGKLKDQMGGKTDFINSS